MIAAAPARRDPAFEVLTHARRDAEERADRALNAIVRLICGGLSWSSTRVREQRSAFLQARDDYFVASSALATLDVIDVDCKQRKRERSQVG